MVVEMALTLKLKALVAEEILVPLALEELEKELRLRHG